MVLFRRGGRRLRLWFLLFYLAIVVAGAIALWLLVPEDVKKAIYETYVSPP